METFFDFSRFSRNILLNEIDFQGQERICQVSILCIGCGGLANHILPILVASGVGRVGIVDFDIISDSNLPRQTVFMESDIKKNKVASMKDFLELRNSKCVIDIFYEKSQEIIFDIAKNYDIIIDSTDSLASRIASNRACIQFEKPFFTGASQGFVGHVYSFANHLKGFPCYECLFSEIVENEKTCENSGVFPPIVQITGGFIASNVLKYIVGINLDFTEFLIFDILGNNRKINFLKESKCKVCVK